MIMLSEKCKVFEKELALINDSFIRRFTEETLDKVPDYFFEVAASSTGKYHPKYALGEGGLVRHTKAAIMIADCMINDNPMYDNIFTSLEKDIIISSLILHDTIKHGLGYSNYSVSEHPMLVEKIMTLDTVDGADAETLETIRGCIRSHMGPWNKDYRTKREIMPVPSSAIERFVHMCDYLASRKFLEVVFD
jgi:hypothetical protein